MCVCVYIQYFLIYTVLSSLGDVINTLLQNCLSRNWIRLPCNTCLRHLFHNVSKEVEHYKINSKSTLTWTLVRAPMEKPMLHPQVRTSSLITHFSRTHKLLTYYHFRLKKKGHFTTSSLRHIVYTPSTTKHIKQKPGLS